MSNTSQFVIDHLDGPLDWDQYGPDVTKIVLGNCPTDDDATAITIGELPDNLATRFPALTHLHLWKVQSLDHLPALPPSLQGLDVRSCEDLVELTELPDALELLDIGYCPKLAKLPHRAPKQLQRFYFDGCVSLTTRVLENMLASLKEQATPIVEIHGTNTPAVQSLREFPTASLKKLVLSGCENLKDVENIAEFQQLDHLDLQGCTKLETLPNIPTSLRYLALQGADQLTTFMGQSIGPYDRGHQQGQNVAEIFHTRRKFGGQLAIMPHAKLLLMGDGRVGKTTLAKRLQWEQLDDSSKQSAVGIRLKPLTNENPTHKVQFWRWETGLTLPADRLDELMQRGKAAGATMPVTADGSLDGAVRIWDFGGQELYHNTHRIFASEGSIFLLVWRAKAPDPGPVPSDVTPEQWNEWNRQRSLDYWLDYIYSLRPDANVALVCTGCKDPDKMSTQPNWRERATRHRDRDLPCFFVDSLDTQCGQHHEYRRLVDWIREACGREADRIGILQPAFFRDVSHQVDVWLQENSRARNSGQQVHHLLLNWQAWLESVDKVHRLGRGDRPLIDLQSRDVTTVTDYLHDAGHLFQIRHHQNRAVLIDQEWAADLIYRLLWPGSSLRERASGNGGWFFRTDLENDAIWQTLIDDAQRERLLDYMRECRIITRIADRRSHRLNQDVYLASDKWLLPKYEDVQQKIETMLRAVRTNPDMEIRQRFDFADAPISEFEFRGLQSYLAGFFGTRGVYFRTGLQAMDQDAKPNWCFRIRWSPTSDDAFLGKLDAVFVARSQQLESSVRQIEELIHAEGSPLADARKRGRRKVADPIDFTHEYFRPLHDLEYDVAVSSSGSDKDAAGAMVTALQSAGFRVNWYRLPECRSDDREGVLAFMNTLRQPKCIVLLVSAGYLRDDPFENWYCPWELADAIRQIHDGNRTIQQTVLVFRESDEFKFANFDAIVRSLFETLAAHFSEAYKGLDVRDWDKFQHYHDFARLFSAALETEAWNKFFAARGSLGSAIGCPTPGNSETDRPDFTQVIAALKSATGR